jgi:hypothetical protein
MYEINKIHCKIDHANKQWDGDNIISNQDDISEKLIPKLQKIQ